MKIPAKESGTVLAPRADQTHIAEWNVVNMICPVAADSNAV